MTALAALFVGTLLAAHHPLWPVQALVVLAAWILYATWRPSSWLFVIPSSLPLLNFSPWTGWLIFDEFDLLLLGVVVAGHARLAWKLPPQNEGRTPLPRTVVVLVLLFCAASVIGLWRGFADAGGLSFGWFQSYADPMNSLRVFKPLLWVVLLAAPLRDRIDDSRERAMHHLAAGMWFGLSLAGLAVLWERIAHPGLLNFTLPYRTVGLFWEMHVGGAAIDAYLALAAPFAAWGVWSARTPLRWCVAALVALLTGYVCLTTFSRGVYVAVAAPLVLLGVLLAGRLSTSGPTADVARRALAAGASIVVATGAIVGAYALAGYSGAALAVLTGVALLAAAARRSPVGSVWRSAAGRALTAALVVEALAVAWTGSFLIDRMSHTDRDLGSRIVHWRNGLGLLSGPSDLALGLGLGRLPANYARLVREGEFSGAVQWHADTDGRRSVSLAGPESQRRLAGQYSLMQQVPLPQSPDHYLLEFDYRVSTETPVFVGICELHLLYERRCQRAFAQLKPGATSWQHISVRPVGSELDVGPWFAPRLGFFEISVLEANRAVDIANASLKTMAGRELLRNGDFSRQLAHWFPVAQDYYVPWHIDNLYLELLIERGPLALLCFVATMAWALRHLLTAPSRETMLAPFLAASLCGVLLVGLVSSVLDAPRPAFLMLFLLAFALLLHSVTSRAASPSTQPPCP